MFPEILIQTLIYGSLFFTGIGVIALLVMLYKDFKTNNLW